MQFINLTPHAINLANADGEITLTIPASGQTARIASTQTVVGEINGIPVRRTDWGQVEGLPEAQEGVVFVVSTLVAQAVRRADVVSPDTGPTDVREGGLVKAVRALQAF